MYQTLTFYHSIIRWLLLLALLTALIRAFHGYRQRSTFSKTDNAVRHWTATLAHIQLVAGMLLYIKSPVISYFWKNTKDAVHNFDALFFALIHILLMLTAIVFITIGSSLAKRKEDDQHKFRTMLMWYGLAALLIAVAVPWPFSPFAQRPYLR